MAAKLSLEDPIAPRLPAAGPIMITVPGISDVVVTAATVGPEVKYRMPGPYLYSGIWIGDDLAATAAAVANIRLRIQDDSRNELLIDGQGGDNAGALSLIGRSSFRWQPFRRVVRAGAKWLFQLENRNAFDIRALFYFKVEVEH